MSEKFLHRGDAPFSETVWSTLDAAVLGAATSQLSGRRILHIDGPFGLGLKAVPGADKAAKEAGAGSVAVLFSESTPVAKIEATFTLAARDIAAFESSGLPMNLDGPCLAAVACAQQEDALIYSGAKELGVSGLLTAKGTESLKLGSWAEVGAAADDLIKAVTRLDAAGFHGPYTLALAPALYNLLYRRYSQGPMTELEHLRTIATEGVVKAPGIAAGGVLLASGRQFASIIMGQDLTTGFIGPAGGGYELFISESLALRLAVPAAVCVLK